MLCAAVLPLCKKILAYYLLNSVPYILYTAKLYVKQHIVVTFIKIKIVIVLGYRSVGSVVYCIF